MKKEAILHIPLSQYAYAEGERKLTIRLRTAKNDIEKCLLYYGDRVDLCEPVRVKAMEMQKKSTDDLYDYYETEVCDKYSRVCYYFYLKDKKEENFYYGRGFCKEMDCHRTEYFQFPYLRREEILDIPEWAEDIVMYHIFPDSFASGKRSLSEQNRKITYEDEYGNSISSENHLGGTLNGVKENLDYLQEMGINCIYLNPIFVANSYHKYDTFDYFHVDPCMGTDEDLKELVKQCHARDIRVILDGVFNHCGSGFFAFQDVLKKGAESEYYSWFYDMPVPVLYLDPPNYEAFAYVKEMPKMNTGNQQVVDYFCRVGKYWIEKADIDGWRLDVANEINHDFWRSFRKAVRSVKRDCFLIAEIWEDANVWLQGDQFDSTMNYTFSYLCTDFFATRKIKASEFDEQIQKMIMRYPRRVSLTQMNLLDSHDVPRFLSYCKGDRKRMELAFFYLFMSVGIPSVFYGDESYIQGVTEPEYRAPMQWKDVADKKVAPFKEWIQFRRDNPALSRGDYKSVYTDDNNGIYAFIRNYQDNRILVVLNNSDQDYEMNLYELFSHKLRIQKIDKTDSVKEQYLIQAMSGEAFRIIE